MELVVDLKERSYPIIIENGVINRVAEEVSKVYNGRRIFIVTDDNVNKYYGDKVVSSLKNKDFEVKLLSLEPGEKTKNFNTLPTVYDALLDFNLTRSDLIIALGGGVIGDLTGFVASTYLRGVDFIQIPTSLLAQVDSSVGGKVAVDLERGKKIAIINKQGDLPICSVYEAKGDNSKDILIVHEEIIMSIDTYYHRLK